MAPEIKCAVAPRGMATKAPLLSSCSGEDDLDEQEGNCRESEGFGFGGWSGQCLGEGKGQLNRKKQAVYEFPVAAVTNDQKLVT